MIVVGYEISGFVASALVLMTFAMKDMRMLRITAIMSNVAFIIYSLTNGLIPVLALHVLLLPLNFYRLQQASRSEIGCSRKLLSRRSR
jgi:CRP/FNR family transcriptional regulator, cyclic AMP receptor protein